MHRLDSRWPRIAATAFAAVGSIGACLAASADPSAPRFSAPITISAAAPFVELALPPSAYAHAMQPELRDLRVVDANGERVPFAWLAALRAVLPPSERQHEATLYPMPRRPVDGTAWPSPVEVSVVGDRITVRRSGAMAFPAEPSRESPGWLIDLGETKPGEPLPRRVRLRWDGPAEFSAAYVLETSDDLRNWHQAGSGQLMALQSSSGVLAQPWLVLPEASGRFVRLAWTDRASVPALLGATVFAPALDHVAAETATELVFAPVAAPPPLKGEADTPRSLHFDLGGDLPIVDLDLRFASGTRVAPVRLQGRSHGDDPWRDIGSGVFYRLERDGTVAESPAIAISDRARYVRVVPDERAAALVAGETRLVVRARLATLVFATTGPTPFRLLAGSPDAPEGALPIATLVPRLDEERSRFGRAALGEFSEEATVVRAAEIATRRARYRPWLLWAVLVIGVGVLGALVWRLARSGPATEPPTT
jgi:hypothetical protein